MKRFTKATVVVALSLLFALAALTACSGQSDSGGNADSGTNPDSGSQASAIDTSGWQTLGDAFDAVGAPSSWSYDDEHFICSIEQGETVVLAVAKMDSETGNKLGELDFFADDYNQQAAEVLGGLELVSAKDVTADRLSADAMNALVGKTGQELYDEGFVFSNYYYYGGEETGVVLENGYYNYDFIFDVTVSEAEVDSDLEGAAVAGATVTSVELAGLSNAALDPASI